jgi:Tfp pilus assembly protein FimV
MPNRILYAFFVTALIAGGAPAAGAQTPQSQRVHVFELDQKYWDVEPGDTLGDIAKTLLPEAPAAHRRRLMKAIVQLNRDAFIHGDPDRLRAYTRLWLPGSVQTHAVDPVRADEVENYSWGTIKRLK